MTLADQLTADVFARARRRVARSRAAGRDGVRPQDLTLGDLHALRDSVLTRAYRPGRLARFPVRKPSGGERILSVPTAADRVVQTAVLLAAGPRLDHSISPRVHGGRPGRGVDSAVRDLLRQAGRRPWLELVGLDLRAMFDELLHTHVRAGARRAWADPLWHTLVEDWLRAWPTRPGQGVPQGAPLSPLLADLALGGLDRALDTRVPELVAWVRYVDDLVLVGQRRGVAEQLLRRADDAVRQQGLAITPRKTRIARPVVAPRLFALGEELGVVERGGRWHIERATFAARTLGRTVHAPWWLRV